MELMVTTLRNTLERPSGRYFSPGLEQRLEPKAWCLLVSYSPLAHVLCRGILAPPAAAAEEDDSKSIPNYVLDCGDIVDRRSMKGLMDFT